jgi:protein-S-isoprenylcysteine O-methyltransferase Ste14
MHDHSHENLAGEKPGSHQNQTILMVIFFVAWILDSFLLRFTTFLSGPVPIWIHLVVAAAVLVVAIYFMRGSHKDLFDTPQEGIARNGVYAHVRNPMYLSTILVYLGLAIATLSLLSLALCIFIFIIYNDLANYEEKKLEEKFGDDFIEYRRTVRKWLPT